MRIDDSYSNCISLHNRNLRLSDRDELRARRGCSGMSECFCAARASVAKLEESTDRGKPHASFCTAASRRSGVKGGVAPAADVDVDARYLAAAG